MKDLNEVSDIFPFMTSSITFFGKLFQDTAARYEKLFLRKSVRGFGK